MKQETKQFTLEALCTDLDIRIQGDPACLIEGVATIQAGLPGRISFLMNPLYKKYLPMTKASAVILLEEDAAICPVNALICKDPYFAYAKIAA